MHEQVFAKVPVSGLAGARRTGARRRIAAIEIAPQTIGGRERPTKDLERCKCLAPEARQSEREPFRGTMLRKANRDVSPMRCRMFHRGSLTMSMIDLDASPVPVQFLNRLRHRAVPTIHP